MGDINAFSPVGNNAVLAATTASGNVALAQGGNTSNVRVYNDAAATAYVALGGAGVTTSATTGLPLAAGASILLNKPPSLAYGAAVLASGAGNVHFTTGMGF